MDVFHNSGQAVPQKKDLPECPFNPIVSIIIPVYNGANYMREAIDSALAQTYGNIEVIVINDGSCDCGETERIALSYGNKIRYYAKPNGGVATALNFGIEKMNGEYFSWLSHDDMYLPQKIEGEIDTLAQLEDKTTLVAEGFQVVDANGQLLFSSNLCEQYAPQQLENPLFCLFHGGIHGCTLLIHKSHFMRAGVFNPELKTTQDYDLFFKIFRGRKMVFMPTMNVLSRSHNQQGSKALAPLHLKECDALWVHMMSELTDSEKKELSGSAYFFYKELRNSMFSGYRWAHAFVYYAMLLESIKEYSLTGNDWLLTDVQTCLGLSMIQIEETCNKSAKTSHQNVILQSYQEDNAYLKRALDQEAQFLDAMKEQVRILRTDCERLSQQAQQEASAATDLASLAEERAQALQDQQAQITGLLLELDAVRGQVRCYETSTIWRMTAPLRKLLDFLKGM